MHESVLTRGISRSPALVGYVIVALMLVVAQSTSAGIIVPPQVGFDAHDLDLAMSASDSNVARSSSSAQEPAPSPAENGDENSTPFDLLKATLPVGSSPSGSTTSSSGSGASAGMVMCLPSASITISDDRALGQLAEDHGLFLPTPPGTDLLRPPQASWLSLG